jgi:Rrf2 family protein
MSGPANTRFSMTVHVLTLLADRDGTSVGSYTAAASVGTNAVHIRRIMANLRRAGIVASRSGAGGGWTLSRPAADITLAQVWDAVHSDQPVVSLHPDPNPGCRVGEHVGAILDAVSVRVSAAVRSELAGTTIADVHDQVVGRLTASGAS